MNVYRVTTFECGMCRVVLVNGFDMVSVLNSGQVNTSAVIKIELAGTSMVEGNGVQVG